MAIGSSRNVQWVSSNSTEQPLKQLIYGIQLLSRLQAYE